MEQLTNANLNDIMKNKVVFIDFWADWCGPCKAIAPIYEAVAKKYEGKATFVKCNVDEMQSFAIKNGISTIPSIVAYISGSAVDKSVGVVTEEKLSMFVEKYI